jgi:hypothetical protein
METIERVKIKYNMEPPDSKKVIIGGQKRQYRQGRPSREALRIRWLGVRIPPGAPYMWGLSDGTYGGLCRPMALILKKRAKNVQNFFEPSQLSLRF